MDDPREFEEGMSNQDIERFRTENGMPLNGLPDEEDDEVCGDFDSWLLSQGD